MNTHRNLFSCHPTFLGVAFGLILLSTEAWGGGGISGKVIFRGVPPTPRERVIDSQACGGKVRSVIVGKKGEVKNAVVFLQGPIAGVREVKVPEGGFVIRQDECRFEPHVRIIGRGLSLEVVNEDRGLHSFHTKGRQNPEISKTQSPSLMKMILQFDRPEIFEVRCDVHPWKQAWLVVAEHPYYIVTGDDGSFHLSDVPAGDYTLHLWHESLGNRSKRVSVKEGEETKADFKWGPP